MRGDCLQVATLIDIEGIAEVERQRRLVILHIECEGTLPGMHAVGVQGDGLSRSAVGRALDNAGQHLAGQLHRLDAVGVADPAVLTQSVDARFTAIHTCHHLVGDLFLGICFDEEMQELRSLWRGEFRRHGGEEIVPQELADVASEVLLEVKHLEGGEDLAGVAGDSPQLEILD